MKNPMQPFHKIHDVVRFKRNKVVDWMLEKLAEKGVTLNDFPYEDFPQDDLCQFYQLIGYSLCGYHELCHVSDEHAREASEKARETFPEAGGCRDHGCEFHCGVESEDK